MQVVWMHLDDIKPYEWNARQHNQAQVAQISASIREFGWTVPILVDRERTVVAGHGRLEAARDLGMSEVPTLCLTDLTPQQVDAYRLADNQLTVNSVWDMDLLGQQVRELAAVDFNLDVLGFHDQFLDNLIADEQVMVGNTVAERMTEWDNARLVDDITETEPLIRTIFYFRAEQERDELLQSLGVRGSPTAVYWPPEYRHPPADQYVISKGRQAIDTLD